MLSGETNPYSAAFIFYLLPSAVSFFLFDFLIRYTGTGVAPEMYAALRTIGALMVLSGGLWAVYRKSFGPNARFCGCPANWLVLAGSELE